MAEIKLLDCTLRDGAYIVDGKFGESAIKGIISMLQNAGVDMIECGWLKNAEYTLGTTYYREPNDLLKYIAPKNKDTLYVAMIDWDRYNLDYLPQCDGKTLDAIRVVFPYQKYKEGIEVGRKIQDKGYRIFYQAANTLAYSDDDLRKLAKEINSVRPDGISIVDTFGAMYEEDLTHILQVLDSEIDKSIRIGFHSHNNQQMAFANSMKFVEILMKTGRDMIVDASLCGMGRGAGNATTELMVNFLNRKCQHNYDLDSIMDAIDIYMTGFQEKYSWGYSTAYCIAGMYCCHVNNIAYLQNHHRTNARDMRNIIESLEPDARKKYDYDLLEQKYIENQDRQIDDKDSMAILREQLEVNGEHPVKILLVAPGKSALTYKKEIQKFIKQNTPYVIAVNALLSEYNYDCMFVTNAGRYEYAKTAYPEKFQETFRILLSNIKSHAGEQEVIVNYNRAIKRGWPHFDNAVICALRLMDRIHVKEVYLAGFDGFKNHYNESYADEALPTLNPDGKWDELNEEIKEMFRDVQETTKLKITFLTQSIYGE